MADQGRWFKFWISALRDPDLQNLSLENIARWAMFGAFLKEQGNGGCVVTGPPGKVLVDLFRVTEWSDVLEIIRALPNCTVRNGKDPVTVELSMRNWLKYQEDTTGAIRQKEWRARRSKKRREETRREDRDPGSDSLRESSDPPPTPQGESNGKDTVTVQSNAVGPVTGKKGKSGVSKAEKEKIRTRKSAGKLAFDFWVWVMEKRATTMFTPERRRKVEGRLRDGYTLMDLIRGICGCAGSKWHQGDNEEGVKHEDLELICRNGVKLDALMERSGGEEEVVKTLRKYEEERGVRVDLFLAGGDSGPQLSAGNPLGASAPDVGGVAPDGEEEGREADDPNPLLDGPPAADA